MQVGSFRIQPRGELDARAHRQGGPVGGLRLELIERVEHDVARGDAALSIPPGARDVADTSSQLQSPRHPVQERETGAVVVQPVLPHVVSPVHGPGEGAERDRPRVLDGKGALELEVAQQLGRGCLRHECQQRGQNCPLRPAPTSAHRSPPREGRSVSRRRAGARRAAGGLRASRRVESGPPGRPGAIARPGRGLAQYRGKPPRRRVPRRRTSSPAAG